MTTRQRKTLSDEDLQAVMGLLKRADSVELKLTVPEADHRSALLSLDIDPLDAQMRQVFFYDTPDLRLNQKGLVVRARRIQGKGGDSVIKLRPVKPDELLPGLRKSPNFNVEVDAVPGGYVCSATLKQAVKLSDPREVVAGTRPLRKLFSKEQRTFYKENAPDGVGLDDLSILGPITVFKLRFAPEGFGRRMVAELWMYPDYSRILELSTKCHPGETFQVAAESLAFLTSRGLDLSADQQMKTKTALEYFSQHLAPPVPAVASVAADTAAQTLA